MAGPDRWFDLDSTTAMSGPVSLDPLSVGEQAARLMPFVGEWRAPRVCRGCGCTDDAACITALGPCAWAETFDDNSGVCTGCVLA